MNYSDIIKAVECCEIKDCHECPYRGYTNCMESVMHGALDIINRQKSKIERLKRYDEERDIRLHARLTGTARAEAIKEFAERLKENISNMEYTADVKRKTVPTETLFAQVNWVFHEIVPETIDSLVKEMTEVRHAETD